MSQDTSFRKEYEEREKALMDEAAGIAHALNKGREQGHTTRKDTISSWYA